MATASESHDPVTPVSVGRILWRRRFVCAIAFLLIAVIGSIVVLIRPKTYESSSSIALLPVSTNSGVLPNYPNLITSLIPTYVQLISSPALLNRVAAGLPFRTSGAALANDVSAQSLSSAAVINIVATSTNPVQARQIALETTKVFLSQLRGNGVVVPKIYGLPSATATPAPPRRSLLLLLVLVLAAILGLVAGLLWDRLSTPVAEEEEPGGGERVGTPEASRAYTSGAAATRSAGISGSSRAESDRTSTSQPSPEMAGARRPEASRPGASAFASTRDEAGMTGAGQPPARSAYADTAGASTRDASSGDTSTVRLRATSPSTSDASTGGTDSADESMASPSTAEASTETADAPDASTGSGSSGEGPSAEQASSSMSETLTAGAGTAPGAGTDEETSDDAEPGQDDESGQAEQTRAGTSVPSKPGGWRGRRKSTSYDSDATERFQSGRVGRR